MCWCFKRYAAIIYCHFFLLTLLFCSILHCDMLKNNLTLCVLLNAKVIRNSLLCLYVHVIQDDLHFLCFSMKMNTVLNMAGKSVSVFVSIHYDYYSKLYLRLAKNLISVFYLC